MVQRMRGANGVSSKLIRAVAGAGVASLSLLAGAWTLSWFSPADTRVERFADLADGRSIDAGEKSTPVGFNLTAIGLRSSLQSLSAKTASLETAPAPAKPSPSITAQEQQSSASPQASLGPSSRGDTPPLPPRRPSELAKLRQLPQAPISPMSKTSSRAATASAGAETDGRTLIEKFFGSPSPSSQQKSGTALAYAAPESPVGNMRSIISGASGYDRWTAIYDISAHKVYLPNGTTLEAHSGLGPRLDDPRFVHERMRGATPPNIYELSPRERLFHGVQALRLKPVGNQTVFGRTGLLAHTYMLGPKGDSNGCVSFRNYEAFLQAYQRGEIKRLAVVATMR